MSEKLSRILEYEKQLIQSRQQLLDLLSEIPEDNEELIRYKLECFQKEIAFMNRQVELLKENVGTLQVTQELQATREAPGTAPLQAVQAAQGIVPKQTTQGTTQEHATDMAASIPKIRATRPTAPSLTEQTASKAQQPEVQTVAKELFSKLAAAGQSKIQNSILQRMASASDNQAVKKDLEQTVGKSLMGIFASVLVFISLILFATLLLPYFTDTLKMLTTYALSFAFLGLGLFKMKKDKTNKFYMALTGCGIGALYISLLLSNIYFKVLGDIPLYVLICVWGIAVCLFARQKSPVFRIIGELGITVSVIFGCVLCTDNEDTVKMLALIIFYIVSSAIFYIVHFEKEFHDNLVHHVSNVINVYILTASTLKIMGEGLNHFEVWLMLVIVLISIAGTLWHSLEKDSVSFSVFAIGYAHILYLILTEMLGKTPVFGMITYVAMVALLVLYECKRASGKMGKYIVQSFLLIMATTALMSEGDLYHYGMVPLLILPALLFGFFRKNQICKYASMIMLFFYIFEEHADTQIPHFLLCLTVSITGFIMIWWKKEQYSRFFKYSLHLLTLLFLFTCVSDVAGELASNQWREGDGPSICNYILFTLYNIGMMKSVYGKNLATGERENLTVYKLVNMLSMVVGTFMIALVENGFLHILLILTVLGAYMINAKNLLDKRDNLLFGIYVGFKFTLLMIVIQESFDSANYVVSISCLLLAIASIVLGFAAEYKSLRVFGLILAMISIFKLIMVDISYDNTLGHAISFFVSGILCFAISLIYNYISKQISERA